MRPARILAQLRRLDKPGMMIGITVLAGFSEGLGITLFVPLIQLIEGSADGGGGNRLTRIIMALLDAVGLPFTVATVLLVAGLLIIGGFALGLVQRQVIFRAKNGFLRDTRRRLMDSLLHADWDHLSRQASGSVMAGLLGETQRAAVGLQMLSAFVANLILLAIYTSFTAVLSWKLLLVAVVFSGFTMMVIRPVTMRSAALGRVRTRSESAYGFVATDILRNARYIKVSGLERAAAEHVDRRSLTAFEASNSCDEHSAIHLFLLQAVPVVTLCLIIALAHYALRIEASVLFVFLLLLGRIAPRVAELQQRYETYLKSIGDLDTIDAAIANAGARGEPSADAAALPERPFLLRMERVSLTYPGQDRAAVEDVDLEIAPRSLVALVGGSGAGKTTLVDLIAAVRRPTAGRVLVGGRDLGQIPLTAWRHCLGYVTQDVALLNDTIRANLLFGRTEVSEQRLWQVLDMAHLGDTVRALPNGLDCEVGEGGVRLSGGQKQRLSLARALVHDPDILILDEATSALDSETERAVQQAIDDLRHRLTIVVVAHRLSTVRAADRIFVLEAGRVVEAGAFDELLDRKGRFAGLYAAQFS